MIKVLIYIYVFWAVMFADYSDAHAERYFWCGNDRVWVGDSLASVQMLCGRPRSALRGPAMIVTENQGPVSITRFIQTIWYIYPGNNSMMYYLKFVNHELVSIDQDFYGHIPK